MKPNSITCYPVGNGSTTLITLSDGATILADYYTKEDEVFAVGEDIKCH
jgi:hypothetical protein